MRLIQLHCLHRQDCHQRQHMDIPLFFLFLHCMQDSLPTMISNVPCQSYETTSGRPLNSGFSVLLTPIYCSCFCRNGTNHWNVLVAKKYHRNFPAEFATLFLANDWYEAHYSDEKVENLSSRTPVSLESINPIQSHLQWKYHHDEYFKWKENFVEIIVPKFLPILIEKWFALARYFGPTPAWSVRAKPIYNISYILYLEKFHLRWSPLTSSSYLGTQDAFV